MCYYNFEEFRLACSRGFFKIIVFPCAEKNAREHFNLAPKIKLLQFIYNNGLENLKHLKIKDWEKNPNPNNPIKVDSYEFYSKNKLGYIAFMYNGVKWIIKSFKLSTRPLTKIEEEVFNKGIIELIKGK